MLPCASCCHGLCVLPCTSVVAMYIASYHLVIVTVYVSFTRPTCLSALQVLSTGVEGGGIGESKRKLFVDGTCQHLHNLKLP